MRRKRQPQVNAGDTFLPPRPYNHLYVVCSEPAIDAEHVLLVSFTTWGPKEENCCIVHAGEHPFFTHRTCVRYKDARITSVAGLLDVLAIGGMCRREPVSSELLARVRAGASKSDFLPEGCRQILQSQGLI